MRVGWVYHRFFHHHVTEPAHPEQADRLTAIVEALEAAGLMDKLTPLSFAAADAETLALVHEPAYVELVRLACEQGMTSLGDADTRICPRSYDVAALACGGVLAACDAVMARQVERAFCAVRPPGHHAERDRAMGFCLFNHVAVAAEHLVRRHGLGAVAIVDFDAHHGNGTQRIFEDRRDVLYVSVHENPHSLPFPGTGAADQIGRGDGAGFTLNVPLPPGSGDAEHRRAFDEKVLPRLREFVPRFVLVSAGFDAMQRERVAHLSLEPQSYGWMTAALGAVADACCGGRLVSVLEGGYEPLSLGQAVAAHVGAMMR